MEWSQARNNQIEYCYEGISSLSPAVGAYASVPRSYYNPANTLRNNNVVITSKRRHFDVTTSKWRRFDVTTTLLLRHVFRGNFPYETPSFLVYHDKPWRSEPRLNIKTVLSTYGDFHVKDKTAVRTSYL